MYGGRTLQVEGMYRDGHYNKEECNAKECTGTDITSERNVQWTENTCERNRGKRLQLRG